MIQINEINTSHINQIIETRGFLHQVRRTGKQAFLVIRDQMSSIQGIAYVDGQKISKEMIQFIGNIPKESVVDIKGIVIAVEKPVESCTQSNIEIHVHEIFVVSRAISRLPLQIEDAMRPDGDDNLAKVNLDTKLDHRVLDLRTPTNQAILNILSSFGELFILILRENKFRMTFVPHMISCASEGGANVFELKYFLSTAYLAQSPQLYKQMGIIGGRKRVFVMGPVFRAENSNTHRHLTEFNCLDLEMQFYLHYHEVLDTLCQIMVSIFKMLEQECQEEINIVARQYPAKPFEYLEPTLVLTFTEGVQMLRQAGVTMGDHEDLTMANEKLLGRLVKIKFGTDFYVLDKFPLAVRPFYTMPDPEDPEFSNSYDFFMRGEEIMTGGQRIHGFEMLKASAIAHGVNLDSIRDYLNAFQYGVPPHAGGGIGLERVVMLYLGLPNIRMASMFPRDPKRLTPWSGDIW